MNNLISSDTPLTQSGMDNRYKLSGLFLLVIIFTISMMLSSCSGVGSNFQKVKEITPLPDVSQSIQIKIDNLNASQHHLIAESESLRLLYQDSSASIRIEDKRTGKIWNSIFDAGQANVNINSTGRQDLASALLLTYTSRDGNENIMQSSVMRLKPLVWTKKMDNGIKMTYYFKNEKLGFDVDIRLAQDQLRIKIPYETIREEGKSRLVNLQIFPFISLCENDQNGYYLLPDGSGALMKLDNPFRAPTQTSWATYSAANANLNQYDRLDKSTEILASFKNEGNIATFPMFGAHFSDGTFAAYAVSAEEEFQINVATEGMGLPYNRIFGAFSFHNVYEVDVGSIKKDSAGNVINSVYQRTDNVISPVDRELVFDFLSSEKSDYSGMAESYRTSLEANNRIRKTNINNDVPAVVLDLLMGTYEQSVSGKFINVTTFEQVQQIVGELTDGGVRNLIVNLRGWNKNGYGAYPMNFSTGKQSGGDIEIKKLVAFCKVKKVILNLDVNLTDISSQYAGIAASGYGIRDANNITVTNTMKNVFLMNNDYAKKQFDKLLGYADKISVLGIVFDRIGELVVRDYSTQHFSYRGDTIRQYKDYLKTTVNKYGFSGIRGANLYGASAALIMETKNGGSLCELSDQDVPVYQMLVHSYTAYTSNAINLFSDPAIQRLKNIEYGANPYFELSYEMTNKLIDTKYNQLFSGKYSLWKNIIIETSKEYDKLQTLFASPMIRHRVLENKLVVVQYQNGHSVVINYSKEAKIYEQITIDPLSYKITKEVPK